jgi:hypothetical protein
MNLRKIALYSLFGFFLVSAIACAWRISVESRHILTLKEDVAEINRIKYGILSVNQWKDQLASILSKKIEEFQITDENRVDMQKSVESALHKLLDEVKVAMNRKKKEGNFWDRLKGETVGIFFDAEDFRKDIPRFAEAVLVEFEKPETREGLMRYIRLKLDEFVDKTAGHEDNSYRLYLIEKYEASTAEEASQNIQIALDGWNASLRILSIVLILCVIMGFVIWWVSKVRSRELFVLLALLCITPLYSGVSTPMIDIDARIERFSFDLMGEPLEFNNQVLYFQSKSILDVVHILMSKGKADTIVVGFLVMLFSVLFPLFKMTCTALVEFKRHLISNPIIRFFVLKSAKWSMADVLVVSIFMTYIGFKGVIDSQLTQLERSEGRLDVLTTDHTSLQVGFSLFLTFTLAGLVLSSIAQKRFSEDKIIASQPSS